MSDKETPSPVFIDSLGRKWDCSITIATTRRVLKEIGLDLLKMIDDGCRPFGELLGNPIRFTETVFWICKPQADAASITDEGFCEGFDGATLEAAADAFYEGLVGFFKSLEQKRLLRAMYLKAKEVERKVAGPQMEKAEKALQSLDADLIAASVVKQFGGEPATSE